jgi:hypothetical protein
MKCTAHKKDGSPCGSWAIKGANVCRVHGGSAPQVLRKASQRIEEARDLALSGLVSDLSETQVDAKVKLDAVVKLTELHETMEGRVARREEQIVDLHDRTDEELIREAEGILQAAVHGS